MFGEMCLSEKNSFAMIAFFLYKLNEARKSGERCESMLEG
jgi:hypothetical protein